MKLVSLRTSSYDLVGGVHYYGKLAGEGKTQDVVKVLSRAEARLLNRAGRRKSYREGDESIRFRKRSRLRQMAIAQYKKQWPAATHLIEGLLPPAEPKLVLDGPGKDELNSLFEQCESLGWWDGGRIPAVEKVCDEWDTLLERHTRGTTSRGTTS